MDRTESLVKLHKIEQIATQKIAISGSKSETNRLLLLQALYPNIIIKNASYSDDSVAMKKALENEKTVIDIHHAGTAMRFLTAYFAIQKNKKTTLTGSTRMQERPIGILVEALQQIGAEIKYVKNTGFPPLHITGKELTGNTIHIKATISSQYISALLLIAPKLPKGLTIVLEGEITSMPYLQMSLQLLKKLGVNFTFVENEIKVEPFENMKDTLVFSVESDWSSASYFYSILALSPIGSEIFLTIFQKNSLQGDAVIVEMYKNFGVTTTFTENGIVLQKTEKPIVKHLYLNLKNAPDIAQTIAVTCLGLGISCDLEGLHTLKIKETDRLFALQTELSKLGASVTITDNSLHLAATSILKKNVQIATYQDHRMAMAFAPLALVTTISIENPEVVSKSYPSFWEDLEKIGFLTDFFSN